MNARRLFRRYISLVHRAGARPATTQGDATGWPLAAETARPIDEAGGAPEATGIPANTPGTAETEHTSDMLERRRQIAGWVH